MKQKQLTVILLFTVLFIASCSSKDTYAPIQPLATAAVVPTAEPYTANDNGYDTVPVTPPAQVLSSGNEVVIQSFAFGPNMLEAKVGTTVTWNNQDGAPHIVEADDLSFISDRLETGDNFSFTFNTAGTFSYHCGIHAGMKGIISVVP